MSIGNALPLDPFFMPYQYRTEGPLYRLAEELDLCFCPQTEVTVSEVQFSVNGTKATLTSKTLSFTMANTLIKLVCLALFFIPLLVLKTAFRFFLMRGVTIEANTKNPLAVANLGENDMQRREACLDTLGCFISSDTMKKPVILPCGHTFDETPLQQWEKKQWEKKKCCVCQQDYSDTTPNILAQALIDLTNGTFQPQSSVGASTAKENIILRFLRSGIGEAPHFFPLLISVVIHAIAIGFLTRPALLIYQLATLFFFFPFLFEIPASTLMEPYETLMRKYPFLMLGGITSVLSTNLLYQIFLLSKQPSLFLYCGLYLSFCCMVSTIVALAKKILCKKDLFLQIEEYD